MSSIAKSLHQFINHSIACEERLEPYKLTQKQLSEAFSWLDQRRRGYVDVSDFFKKFPQLTEGQLFFVFKFLDASRKETLTYQNLEKIICTCSPYMGQSQDDPIRTFTNLVKILKATFHLIEQQNKKLGLTNEAIQQIFGNALSKTKDRLEITDLLILFRESNLQINERVVMFLKNRIFIKASLSRSQFVQNFSQFVWDPSSHRQLPLNLKEPAELKKQLRAQKITSQIDKILQKYKNNRQQPQEMNKKLETDKYKLEMQTYMIGSDKYKPQIPRQRQYEQYNFNIEAYENQISNKRKLLQNSKKEDLFSSMSPGSFNYSQINKRREQLRKGSLQRQRIIDDVINRKKFQTTSTKFGQEKPSGLKIQSRQGYYEGYHSVTGQGPLTPTVKAVQHKINYESNLNPRLYQTLYAQRESNSRPSSASKPTSNTFFQKQMYGKYTSHDHTSKPDLSQFYRRPQTPKSFLQDKQNILRKAQEEATKKIQQIQRRARLKVMEKRSAAGIYNRWLK